MNEIELDWQREQRTGLAEAIFAASKSKEQLQAIIHQALSKEQALFFTKMSTEQKKSLPASLVQLLNYDPLSQTAFLGKTPNNLTLLPIALVTGGSGDVPAAAEALRTLQFSGYEAEKFYDIGVAGLWRLQKQLPKLLKMRIVICFAGMDAALPTVVAGLIKAVIIAVPTSLGYGAAQKGLTALHALLSSCAPGLLVVNIDNGYGAAAAALRIWHNFQTTKGSSAV